MEGWKMSAVVAGATVAAAAWAMATDRPDCQLPAAATWTPIPPANGSVSAPPPATTTAAPAIAPVPMVAPPPAPAVVGLGGWDDCPACGMG